MIAQRVDPTAENCLELWPVGARWKTCSEEYHTRYAYQGEMHDAYRAYEAHLSNLIEG